MNSISSKILSEINVTLMFNLYRITKIQIFLIIKFIQNILNRQQQSLQEQAEFILVI